MARRLIAYTDGTTFGGAEQSLGNLLEFLDGEIEVLVAGVDRRVVETVAGRRPRAATCVLPPVSHKRDVAPFLAHLRAVRRFRPDVFHANMRSSMACQYGILAALLTPGVRVVAVEQSPIPVAGGLQRRLKHLLSRRLTAHVAVGRRSARAVEELAGLPAGSVRTIYNGVPEIEVEPLPAPFPPPVIGAVGRFSREKGLDVLVRALPLLPGTSALLVGDGPERAPLERLARGLGVADRLAITGWTRDARAHVASLDVLAVPSRFEGFPLVIPEGMLAGLPTVASDVGSVAEAVADGKTGLLVPPDDPEALAGALRTLLADAETRRAMGTRAREVARTRFTAPVMATAFEALYAEVAG
ncbi:MAG TPA: glycosyltransferase [Gaiellaceae bacterium]|nr:glycosyltransferase [Gaiellaceae bacterium]